MKQFLIRSVSVPLYRWLLLVGGITLAGFGIALMIQAQIGLGPWDVLHQGISKQTGISIGMVSILVSLPIMLCWAPLRERPGMGTLVNLVLIGVAIDVFLEVLPPLTWFPAQVGQLIAGIVAMGVGSGLYLSAAMGAGPRDGLMMGLVRRTGFSVRLVRTTIELAVLLLGWLLGGKVGIGTLAFAFGIGPVVQTTLHMLAPKQAGSAPMSVIRAGEEAELR